MWHNGTDLSPLDGESWKSIDGFPGYLISDLGRVYSQISGRLLKPQRHSGGYLKACLSGQRYELIHRLVARAFLGSGPDGHEVAHLNGNPSDNRASNLAWVDRKTNHLHKKYHGTARSMLTSPIGRLDVRSVCKIANLIREGNNNSEIAKLFGVSPGTISNIANGKTWSHLTGGRLRQPSQIAAIMARRDFSKMARRRAPRLTPQELARQFSGTTLGRQEARPILPARAGT